MKRKSNRGSFKKGRKKTGGRKPGTPNKVTSDVKQALVGALEKLGGEMFFVRMGRSRHQGALASLFGRLLPLQTPGASPQDSAADIRSQLAAIESTTSPGTQPPKPKEQKP